MKKKEEEEEEEEDEEERKKGRKLETVKKTCESCKQQYRKIGLSVLFGLAKNIRRRAKYKIRGHAQQKLLVGVS